MCPQTTIYPYCCMCPHTATYAYYYMCLHTTIHPCYSISSVLILPSTHTTLCVLILLYIRWEMRPSRGHSVCVLILHYVYTSSYYDTYAWPQTLHLRWEMPPSRGHSARTKKARNACSRACRSMRLGCHELGTWRTSPQFATSCSSVCSMSSRARRG